MIGVPMKLRLFPFQLIANMKKGRVLSLPCLPELEQHGYIALNSGTAINLFVRKAQQLRRMSGKGISTILDPPCWILSALQEPTMIAGRQKGRKLSIVARSARENSN